MSSDRVAVVTGASRGAGAGIARALGAHGYTVYITGRTTQTGTNPLPGTIGETAEQVTRLGGKGIAVCVDHHDDDQVAELFARVRDEQGRLDILVNNAAAVTGDLVLKEPFWNKPISQVDIIDVGLRSSYIAGYHAAPLLIATPGSLVVFTSSFGATCYMHGPAYGAQKAGQDKMAADMAFDFREFGVAAVSIWMGMLKTERTADLDAEAKPEYAAFLANAETPEFTGNLIAALHDSPRRMELSGRTLIGAELGEDLGVTDEGGRKPPSYRAMLGSPPEPNPAVVR